MQVLLKSTNDSPATRCSVCGQGFAMYSSRHTGTGRDEILMEVEAALRSQHAGGNDAAVHPESGFLVPAWDGPVAYSGAAILGNAPRSAL